MKMANELEGRLFEIFPVMLGIAGQEAKLEFLGEEVAGVIARPTVVKGVFTVAIGGETRAAVESVGGDGVEGVREFTPFRVPAKGSTVSSLLPEVGTDFGGASFTDVARVGFGEARRVRAFELDQVGTVASFAGKGVALNESVGSVLKLEASGSSGVLGVTRFQER